jgi:hypothetical protein
MHGISLLVSCARGHRQRLGAISISLTPLADDSDDADRLTFSNPVRWHHVLTVSVLP